MKKLVILSIALLVAGISLRADYAKCNSCSSSKAAVKHVAKKSCTKCVKAGKVCKCNKKCACGKSAKCKCHKGGLVKRTLKTTEEAVEDTGKVLTAPLRAFFRSKKNDHHIIHDNDKVNNEIYINQFEQDNAAEDNNDF